MALRIVQNGWEVLTIVSGDGTTRLSCVPEKGGVVSSLIMPGLRGIRECLFLHDHFWDRASQETPGGMPFLFPICGRLGSALDLGHCKMSAGTYEVDGRRYRLPIHGFGFRMPWHVRESHHPAELVLELNDTPATRALYPFGFRVCLRYRVQPGRVECEQTVTNTGDRVLPYYAGFHPYFLIPEGTVGANLSFTPRRALKYSADFTAITGKAPFPALPLSVPDPALNDRIYELGSEKRTQLRFAGGEVLCVEADDFYPYVQLYSRLGFPFVCVEPWMAYANALNTGGPVRRLFPGVSATSTLQIQSGVGA